jgi:hypothetical protein
MQLSAAGTEASRKSPTQTQRVEDAIKLGFQTLRELADHTGISYRAVNSIVTSLETQGRVAAADPFAKRGEQLFSAQDPDHRPSRKRTTAGALMDPHFGQTAGIASFLSTAWNSAAASAVVGQLQH